MAQYLLIFCVALFLNILISFRASALWKKFCLGKKGEQDDQGGPSASEVDRHRGVLRKYLVVYLLATLSDWLQGPYVYALYDKYGYDRHQIAVLFVIGFGSSMVFGSFVGGMADWGGRRLFVILFAVTYAASCLTKHFKSFNVLVLGRLLGGVATSLLFSVFDAWLIRAHSDAKLSKEFLGQSFSTAFYYNSIIAILAGILANQAANANDMKPIHKEEGEMIYFGGFLNPFDIALFALILCGVFCRTLWEENYGETPAKEKEASSDDGRATHWYDGLKNAFVTTMRSRDILLCGLVSSIFEGSMYIFVFMWTPALKKFLKDDDQDLDFGLIFSTFMVCCMAGSSLFSILIGRFKGEAMAVFVLFVAAISMAVVAFGQTDTVSFVAMNVFEVCVGMYFPIMGTMKGTIVPEDKRAAIYNLYRIPLNFIVLFSLLTHLTPTQSFTLNCCILSLATILQIVLMKRRLNMNSMSDIAERSQQGDSTPLLNDESIPLTVTSDKTEEQV